MRRRVFLAGLIGGALAATAAQARDRSDDILRELKLNGYRIEDVGRTFLGRVRILATKNGGRREIIVNPATGEILRDLWIAQGGGDDWDDWDDDGDDREERDDDSDDDRDDDGDNGDDDKGGKDGRDDD